MIATEPFTRAEELVWFLLESWAGFTDRVAVGNRIKAHTSLEKLRAEPNPQAGDLPEVVVVPSGCVGEDVRHSDGMGVVQTFEIVVSTQWITTRGNAVDGETQTGLNALKWEILQAINAWRDEYPSDPEVWKIDAIPYADNAPGTPHPQNGSQPRGPGWESIITVTVHMAWSKEELGWLV